MDIRRRFSIISLVFAVISFLAATQLTIEKIDLLKNPNYIPSCSINPFISCGPVMQSWQASVFGPPNSIIGMVGYGLVILILFTSLFVKLPRWYWGFYVAGITLAMGFLVWLMTQSMLVIGALCLYCTAVWICTLLLFWFGWGELARGTRFNWVYEYKPLFLTASYVALAICLFFAFKSGWLSLL
jgi:uncharacterized membrane protein